MNDKRLCIAVLTLSTVSIVVLLVCSRPILARAQRGDTNQPAPTYNPYPPGILPSNLSSETARVRRELYVPEGGALALWHALKPPALTDQPPLLQNNGNEAIITLRELIPL